MLFKQVLRTFKNRFLQLLAISVMVLLSSMLYTSMTYSIEGLKQPTFDFFEEANIEDFSIDTTLALLPSEIEYISNTYGYTDVFDLQTLYNTDLDCYNDIFDKRIVTIETDYDITLELREVKQVVDNHKYLFVNDMQIYNKTFYDKGTAPIEGEIAISRYFAENNGYDIGDTITIDTIEYRISGFALFCDYTFPIVDSSMFVDNKKQTFAIIDSNAFETMSYEKMYVHFAGGGESSDSVYYADFADSFNEDNNYSFAYNAVDTESQLRSGGIYSELEGGSASSIAICVMITSLAIVVICIIIGQMISRERTQVGILKALGYTNTEITKPYIILLSIILLFMLTLGYILGYILAIPLKNMYLAFYMLPTQPIEHQLSVVAISIILPTVLILGTVFVIIKRLLKEEALVMMNPKVFKMNFLVKLFSRIYKGKVFTKFKYMISFQSLTKFLVFFIGVGVSSFLMILSFSMMGLVDKTVFQYYESVDFEYQAFCNNEGCPISDDVEQAIYIPNILYEDESISLIALDRDTLLHKLYDINNKDITSSLNEDEVVISAYMEILFNLDVNDSMIINVEGEDITLKIVGISNNYSTSHIYISREDISTVIPTIPSTYSNMVFSKTELDKDDYSIVIAKADITDQASSMSELMDTMILALIIVSFGFGLIILAMIISLIIEDNLYNLSLLKVVGFNKKEVSNLILNSYFKYLMLIFIVCIPFTYVTLQFFQLYMVEAFNIVFPLSIKIYQIVISFVLTISIYIVCTLFSKNKISKISLQESLKIYQE